MGCASGWLQRSGLGRSLRIANAVVPARLPCGFVHQNVYGTSASLKERSLALEMAQQPVMDRRHTMLCECDMAVLVAEVRLDVRQVAS
jgi:hypothetical protein